MARTHQQTRSPADRFISRPALFERLSAVAPGSVTLVCAPAGSGKTILLRSWAAATDQTVAWVTVDRGERDAQRFWLHLIDALVDVAGDEVIERISPAPSFAGAVVVVRGPELRFSLDETRALLGASGITLSDTCRAT